MFQVSVAKPEDVDDVASLLDEVEHYYGGKGDEPREVARKNIQDALFGSLPAGAALLVFDEGSPVGLACYSFLWPASGSTRSLYLKELYVTESYRGRGIGSLLMDALRQIAADTGCSRVEWTADESNPTAQAFYEALGFSRDTSKFFYRSNL